MGRFIFGILAMIFVPMVHAVNLDCYEDPRTNAVQCIDAAMVRVTKDGIRYSKLYTGGPKEVDDSRFTIHSNCATGVAHLKDRQGVSFAGGGGRETPAIKSLVKKICSATVKK